MTTPSAVIVGTALDRRGIQSVRVRCPYCDRHHIHGWDRDTTTSRVSHCGQGDYKLVIPPGHTALVRALS